jgi:hypothetical protein
MATHNDTLIDMVKVVLANLGAIIFGFIQIEQMKDEIEWSLKILSLLTAIGYTIWKWCKDVKKSKNEKKSI